MTTASAQSSGEATEPAWVRAVLHFWFDELRDVHWFQRDNQVDALVRERFLALHEWLVTQDGTGVTTRRPLLAVVIVLDQFSRNLFRGTPRAYAADPIARRLARTAIEHGFDVAIKKRKRLFLYMPFEHSDDHDDQAYSVELFVGLGNEDWIEYARAHQLIINRFGRFPHRNAILNRVSTAEEMAAIEEPMGSF